MKEAAANMDDEAFRQIVEKRRASRMQTIDNMSPALRSLVHDYGFHVVDSFMLLGVESPRHIKHLVETVLDEFSPTRGTGSAQGIRAKRGM